MKLRYVTSYKDRHGRLRHYLRRAGMKSVPLHGAPGSPRFLAAYQRALLVKPKPRPRRARALPRNAIPEWLSKRRDGVYFIKAGDRVKIGHSKSVRARLSAIQTGSPIPVFLTLVLPGGAAEEAQLHRQFASSRIHGEWFSASDDLVEFIAAERTKGRRILRT